jgi:magnesium transporter
MSETLEQPADAESGSEHEPVTREVIDAALAAVEAEDQAALIAVLEPLHEADIADLLEQIGRAERLALIRLWGGLFDGSVLSELEEGVRDEILAELPDAVLAEAVRDLETDDVVYLTEDLDAAQRARVLLLLEDADRVAVERSLQYDEDSAGRLMQREVVVAPEHWTVGDAIDFMRAEDDLPESFYDLIIVGPHMRPVGMVPLGRLMAAARKIRLKELMYEDFRSLGVDTPQEDVAYVFNKYHLISAPVVDAGGRLVGVITIDDAMEALEEEAEEDIRRLAGVGDEELSDGVADIARGRFVWLTVNLATAILASAVIALFTDTIERIVALAVLMPIVASMGGNAGTQTLTVAVRALATRNLTASNMPRFIGREGVVGLLNGVGFAVMIGGLSWLYFADPVLGLVIALAMVGNMVVAAFAGVLIPIALERMSLDPALASGTFVTTITDVFGFFAFLGLAAVLLI